MNWAESVRERGYAVIPEALLQEESDQLFQELKGANLPRSRAGVRHAMRIPAVAGMARGAALLEMAREVLGEERFPFERRCSTSRLRRIGWWCGTWIRRCH